jgi:hypothetical protein
LILHASGQLPYPQQRNGSAIFDYLKSLLGEYTTFLSCVAGACFLMQIASFTSSIRLPLTILLTLGWAMMGLFVHVPQLGVLYVPKARMFVASQLFCISAVDVSMATSASVFFPPSHQRTVAIWHRAARATGAIVGIIVFSHLSGYVKNEATKNKVSHAFWIFTGMALIFILNSFYTLIVRLEIPDQPKHAAWSGRFGIPMPAHIQVEDSD